MGTLTLYIQPGAKRTALAGLHDGKPKIALQARPVEGQANAALIAFLAELLGISRRSIEIISGDTSRTKRVSMPDQACNLLMAKCER